MRAELPPPLPPGRARQRASTSKEVMAKLSPTKDRLSAWTDANPSKASMILLTARLIVISEPDTGEMSLPTCRNDPVPDLLGSAPPAIAGR